MQGLFQWSLNSSNGNKWALSGLFGLLGQPPDGSAAGSTVESDPQVLSFGRALNDALAFEGGTAGRIQTLRPVSFRGFETQKPQQEQGLAQPEKMPVFNVLGEKRPAESMLRVIWSSGYSDDGTDRPVFPVKPASDEAVATAGNTQGMFDIVPEHGTVQGVPFTEQTDHRESASAEQGFQVYLPAGPQALTALSDLARELPGDSNQAVLIVREAKPESLTVALVPERQAPEGLADVKNSPSVFNEGGESASAKVEFVVQKAVSSLSHPGEESAWMKGLFEAAFVMAGSGQELEPAADFDPRVLPATEPASTPAASSGQTTEQPATGPEPFWIPGAFAFQEGDVLVEFYQPEKSLPAATGFNPSAGEAWMDKTGGALPYQRNAESQVNNQPRAVMRIPVSSEASASVKPPAVYSTSEAKTPEPLMQLMQQLGVESLEVISLRDVPELAQADSQHQSLPVRISRDPETGMAVFQPQGQDAAKAYVIQETFIQADKVIPAPDMSGGMAGKPVAPVTSASDSQQLPQEVQSQSQPDGNRPVEIRMQGPDGKAVKVFVFEPQQGEAAGEPQGNRNWLAQTPKVSDVPEVFRLIRPLVEEPSLSQGNLSRVPKVSNAESPSAKMLQTPAGGDSHPLQNGVSSRVSFRNTGEMPLAKVESFMNTGPQSVSAGGNQKSGVVFKPESLAMPQQSSFTGSPESNRVVSGDAGVESSAGKVAVESGSTGPAKGESAEFNIRVDSPEVQYSQGKSQSAKAAAQPVQVNASPAGRRAAAGWTDGSTVSPELDSVRPVQGKPEVFTGQSPAVARPVVVDAPPAEPVVRLVVARPLAEAPAVDAGMQSDSPAVKIQSSPQAGASRDAVGMQSADNAAENVKMASGETKAFGSGADIQSVKQEPEIAAFQSTKDAGKGAFTVQPRVFEVPAESFVGKTSGSPDTFAGGVNRKVSLAEAVRQGFSPEPVNTGSAGISAGTGKSSGVTGRLAGEAVMSSTEQAISQTQMQPTPSVKAGSLPELTAEVKKAKAVPETGPGLKGGSKPSVLVGKQAGAIEPVSVTKPETVNAFEMNSGREVLPPGSDGTGMTSGKDAVWFTDSKPVESAGFAPMPPVNATGGSSAGTSQAEKFSPVERPVEVSAETSHPEQDKPEKVAAMDVKPEPRKQPEATAELNRSFLDRPEPAISRPVADAPTFRTENAVNMAAPEQNAPQPVQSSASVSRPVPVQAEPVEPQPVMEQIASQAKAQLSQGKGEMNLRLVPDHLGRIQMRIAVEDGRVTARIVSETAEARELLERNLPELQAALSRQGLEVREVRLITAGGSGDSFAPGSQDGGGSRHGFAQEHRAAFNSNESSDEWSGTEQQQGRPSAPPLWERNQGFADAAVNDSIPVYAGAAQHVDFRA